MNCKMEDIDRAIKTGVYGLALAGDDKPYLTLAFDTRKWPEEKPSCGSYCFVFSDNYIFTDCDTGEKCYEPIIAYYDGMWYVDGHEDISIDGIDWFVELPKFKKVL